MEVFNRDTTIYTPLFDSNTGLYVDESPFKAHSRNNIIYTCLCNHSHFNTMTSFNNHIKTKSHLKFLVNYKLHIKDKEDAQESSNDYQVKYELIERKHRMLLQRVSELEKELSQHKILNMILRYRLLNVDQFEDCSDTINESDDSSEYNNE
jgi:hypothetical protein